MLRFAACSPWRRRPRPRSAGDALGEGGCRARRRAVSPQSGLGRLIWGATCGGVPRAMDAQAIRRRCRAASRFAFPHLSRCALPPQCGDGEAHVIHPCGFRTAWPVGLSPCKHQARQGNVLLCGALVPRIWSGAIGRSLHRGGGAGAVQQRASLAELDRRMLRVPPERLAGFAPYPNDPSCGSAARTRSEPRFWRKSRRTPEQRCS